MIERHNASSRVIASSLLTSRPNGGLTLGCRPRPALPGRTLPITSSLGAEVDRTALGLICGHNSSGSRRGPLACALLAALAALTSARSLSRAQERSDTSSGPFCDAHSARERAIQIRKKQLIEDIGVIAKGLATEQRPSSVAVAPEQSGADGELANAFGNHADDR